MKTLLILLFSMVMAGEMTVDGNLTVADTLQVTTIQSATIDSLEQLISLQQQQIIALEEMIAQMQAEMALINSLLDNLFVFGDCNEADPGLQLVDACGVCDGDTFNSNDCGNFALSFNSNNSEWIEFYSGIIPSEGDFTVELWMYHINTNANFEEILAQGTAGNAFYIGHDENNNFRIGDGWSSTGVDFPSGNWHNITVVKDANNTYLYIDGDRVNNVGAIPNPNEENHFRIGRQYGGAWEYWNGYIDEVRISNSARYTTMHFTPLDRFESDSNTLALWHFDPNPANLLIDSSPNGNHGTLQNMDGSNWVERE